MSEELKNSSPENGSVGSSEEQVLPEVVENAVQLEVEPAINEIEEQVLPEAVENEAQPEVEPAINETDEQAVAVESLEASEASPEPDVLSEQTNGKVEKKPSFLARLFGRGAKAKKTKAAQEHPTGAVLTAPSQAANGSALEEPAQGGREVKHGEVLEPATLETIRALVKEELERSKGAQPKTPEEILDELLRQHRMARLVQFQENMEETLKNKGDFLSERQRIIQDQVRAMLADSSLPASERVKAVEEWRSVEILLEQDLQRLENALSERAEKRLDTIAWLDEHPVVNSLRSELAQQKQLIETLPVRSTRRVVVPMLLILLILIGLGAAGFIYFNPFAARAEESARLLIEQASLYQASGQNDDALRVLGEIPINDLKNPDLLGRVGEMYRLLKQYDKAVEVLRLALQFDPNNETYLLSLARSYRSGGQNQGAIDIYTRLIQLDPTKNFYYLELGSTYRALSLYDDAIAQYEKALINSPSYWQAYSAIGDVYRDQTKYDEAIYNYQRALEISPDNYGVLINLGISYTSKGDFTAALEQGFQPAIELSPERADAYFYMGEMYYIQGEREKAIESYNQALLINDKYVSAYISLGKTYAAMEDCEQATSYYTEALKLAPNNQEAKEGLDACTK